MIHVDVWQKPTRYCKAIILQLKINLQIKKSKTKKKNKVAQHNCSLFPHSSGGWKSEILEVLKGNLLASFLASAGRCSRWCPRLVDASPCLPLSSHELTLCVLSSHHLLLFMSLCPDFPFLLRTPAI